MDLSYSREEIAFREEVRDFFRTAVPADTRSRLIEGRELGKDDIVNWQRILNKKGWAVPHWPKRWGGTGWDAVKLHIFNEEMQLAPAPQPLPFNVNMLGPVLYNVGSEEQQNYYLPRLANLDLWFCQGFSEPGAGSDLASLKTRAERSGEVYLVNGQKTWTTLAQYADMMFCLVRTDLHAKNRQSGISFLLIDMKSRGITVRPIQTIDGGMEVNEVFFDNVEVPVANRVGEENKGWDYAKFLLGNERTGIARIGASKERLRRIRELASQQISEGRPLIEDDRFLEKLTAIEIELKALEMNQMRVVAAEKHRDKSKPDPASSILKIKGSELQQATTELMLEVLGPFAAAYAPVADDDRSNELEEWTMHIASNYFNYRKVSIYGGSNEIQRNIIAKAVLGL